MQAPGAEEEPQMEAAHLACLGGLLLEWCGQAATAAAAGTGNGRR